MKQKFWKKEFTYFKQLLNIKKNSTNIENNFYKKTEKYIKFIKWIPWILMIWIGNSISMNSAKKSSDIDLFIVTKNNSLWTTRILISLIFQILWVRKTSKKHKWKFCLSFFCSEKWMNFWDFTLKNDIYLYFWIIYFKPILDYNNTYKKFIESNEKWADFNEYKEIIKNNKKYIKYSKNLKKENIISKKIILFLEYIIKTIFIKKTLKNYKKLWKPYWIIINDSMLKFHNNDKRKQIKKELWL
jgi:hypothetical protein